MWQHHLMGKKFELRIDHSGLKYLFGQPSLNYRQSTCLKILSDYDFDIKNIKENENKEDDTLSRRVHELHVAAIIMYKSYLSDKILKDTISDPRYVDIKKKL